MTVGAVTSNNLTLTTKQATLSNCYSKNMKKKRFNDFISILKSFTFLNIGSRGSSYKLNNQLLFLLMDVLQMSIGTANLHKAQ